MFRCIFSARRPTPTQNGSEQPFRRHFEPGQHKNLAPARQGSGTKAPQRGVYFTSHYDISDGATLGNYIASRYIRRACAPGLAGPNGRRGCGRAAKSLLFDPATTLATVRLALQAFRRLDRYARGRQGTSTRNEKSRDAPGQQSSETGNLDAARQAGHLAGLQPPRGHRARARRTAIGGNLSRWCSRCADSLGPQGTQLEAHGSGGEDFGERHRSPQQLVGK